MVIRNSFPALFADEAAASANFHETLVTKSRVNPNCVIIEGYKPVYWLMSYLIARGYSADVVDAIDWRYNSDNSVSVWDR
jgi:hypothetical protein